MRVLDRGMIPGKNEFEQRLWYFQNPLSSAYLVKCLDEGTAYLDIVPSRYGNKIGTVNIM
jgi:hypothetical protein